VGLKEIVAGAKERVREISPQDVKHALDGGEDVLLLDVREPHEYISPARSTFRAACSS
jgi:hypothetical protein